MQFTRPKKKKKNEKYDFFFFYSLSLQSRPQRVHFKFVCFSDSEMAIPTPCASTSDCSNDAEQPEHDYIKMFVGQIPRAMNEQDLMDMFGEFGRVYQLNLLRDKFTGVSKGKVLRFFFFS